MRREILDYYDALAPDYDGSRFGGAYGRFLDAAERRLLARWLPREGGLALDLACGTGRLTDFADVGADISGRSLWIARNKHRRLAFVRADAAALPFAEAAFGAVFSFHLLMHLDRATLAAVFAEVGRVLRPGGVFVADVVSARRRRLSSRPAEGWHAGTALDRGELAALGRAAGLSLTQLAGVAMAPLHRLPERWRAPLSGLDAALCRLSPQMASYLVACFVRAPA
jgi:SAM-dependent methyltransferase